MQREKATNADRELVISRLLDAPRELVWKMWTEADHIKNWWGPDGFTNKISEMNVEPGGVWDFVMHGPDGTDYKNKSIYTYISKPDRLEFDHVSNPKFHVIITFEEQGDQTLLTWKMLFETAELFNSVIKVYKADEGIRQNVDKLEQYLVNNK